MIEEMEEAMQKEMGKTDRESQKSSCIMLSIKVAYGSCE